MVVQWLRLHASNAGGLGLIPGQGTRAQMPQLRVYTLQLRPGAAKQIKLKILKKIQVNKQNKIVTDTENKQMAARSSRGWRDM